MASQPSLPLIVNGYDLGWRNRIPKYTCRLLSLQATLSIWLEWWAMAPADSPTVMAVNQSYE